MADVAHDRAQLVLVGALVLAATLVGLALIVNTVIFTENLATRQSVDTGDAVAYRQGARASTASALAAVNYGSNDSGYGVRDENLTRYLSGWSNTTARYSVVSARTASTSVLATTNGTRVTQDDPGPFRPADWTEFEDENATDPLGLNSVLVANVGSPSDNHTDWAVAHDATLRNHRLTVERTSLASTDDDDVDDITGLQADENVFWVYIDNDTDTWNVSVFDDDDRAGNVSVVVDDGATWSDPEDCTVEATSNGTATLDLTGQELTGADGTVACEPLSFVEDVGSHDVYYVNGDEANGTYEFVADQDNATFESELGSVLPSGVDFADTYYDPGAGHPYAATALYDVELRLDYRSEDLVYRATVRIAPGEPGEVGS